MSWIVPLDQKPNESMTIVMNYEGMTIRWKWERRRGEEMANKPFA